MIVVGEIILPLGFLGVWLILAVGGLFDTIGYIEPPLLMAAIVIVAIVVYYAMRRAQWAILLLLLFVAVILNYHTNQDKDDKINWQNEIKLATWVCMLLICLCNLPKVMRWSADPIIALFVCIGLLGLLSTSYSSVPVVSAIGAVCLLTYLGFACLVTDTVTERSIITTLVWGLAAYCAVGWLVAAVLPSIGIDDTDAPILRFQGVSGHPNLMSRQTAVFLCLVIGAYSRGYISRRSFLPMLGVGVCTLLATQSRTAIMGFSLGLIMLRRKGMAMVLGAGLLLATPVLLTGGSFATLLASLNRADGTDETLAGRDEVWAYTLDQIGIRPLLGYGFNSFSSNSKDGDLAPSLAPPVAHPHNNYLSMLYSGGVISFIPFVTAIWFWARRWLKEPDTLRDLFMLNMLIGSFTEVDIGSTAGLPMMVLFLVLAGDAKRHVRYGVWTTPVSRRT